MRKFSKIVHFALLFSKIVLKYACQDKKLNNGGKKMKILIVTDRKIHTCETAEKAIRLKQFFRASKCSYKEMIID